MNIIQFYNMNQQFIVNIRTHYPFGQITRSQNSTFVSVRKVIPFSNQQTYIILKTKIDILKSLKHPLLLKLISVLEGDNVFHLIYEYVHDSYINLQRSSKHNNIDKETLSMIRLFEYFRQNCILTDFAPKNLGIVNSQELKYYLDIEHFEIVTLSQYPKDCFKLIYMSFQNIKNSEKKELTKKNGGDGHKLLYTQKNINIIKNESDWRKTMSRYRSCKEYNKDTSVELRKSMALETLDIINQRLQQLTKTTKYNPKMRQTFKVKTILRETVRQKWEKYKVKTRKMSGKTIYPDDSNTNRNYNMNSQIQPAEEMKQKNINKQSEIKYEFVKQTTTKKIPLNKNDFQEMKKVSFQNFSKSKETYVRQFLDILDDSGSNNSPLSEKNQIAKPIEARNYSNSTKTTRQKAQNEEQNSNSKIKQRIDKAIRNSHLALEKYGKKIQ